MIEIKKSRSKNRFIAIVLGVSIESRKRGREIMRGKGEGRKREKVEILKILGIYCGSEFLNRTNQNLLYKKCLFVFWWGRKIFKEIMGLKD